MNGVIGRFRWHGNPPGARIGRTRSRDQAGFPSPGASPQLEPGGRLGTGTHVGSHPIDCKFSQESDGRLYVSGKDGDEVAVYPPAKYELREDGELAHIFRTGDFDIAEQQKIEPTPLTEVTDMPHRLHDLNETLARYRAEGGQTSASSEGDLAEAKQAVGRHVVQDARDLHDGPNMIARIRALNLINRARRGS